MTADDTTAETATATPAVTEIVDAPHTRALHRIVCLYSTKGLQLPECTGEAASEVLELGRFAGHYKARSGDIPWVAERGPIAPEGRALEGDPAKDARVENLRAWTIRLRGGRVMLALGIDFDGPLSGAIPLLGETCFNRETLEVDVDGSPLALFDALLAVAPAPGLQRDEGAGFDRDVHQILSAAAGEGELLEPGRCGAPASPNKSASHATSIAATRSSGSTTRRSWCRTSSIAAWSPPPPTAVASPCSRASPSPSRARSS